MDRHPSREASPIVGGGRSVLNAFQRFLHVEAASGVLLIIAAAAALLWANSPLAHSYHQLWEAPIAVHLGPFSATQTLHFVINDGLMTIFFLVVGLEIRREMHDGALAGWRAAALPLVAAVGGVIAPAFTYLALVDGATLQSGWAVPTATDIAFAVGVLALLGKSVPIGVRIFLLAFAVIDDIAAILIIALFYSGGLDWPGLLIVAIGVLGILGLRAMGVCSAALYVIPGIAIWYGLLHAGLHPTLAGVILGLMTPAHPRQSGEGPLESAAAALTGLRDRMHAPRNDSGEMLKMAHALTAAPRELVAPAVSLQASLHPWVAFGIMPLFALANAGVSLDGLDLSNEAVPMVVVAVFVALVLGKPLGIVAGAWIALHAGLCRMPPGLNWPGIWLAAFLGGIGFTMSIFIATLAFHEYEILAAAKLGVLTGSLVAGLTGVIAGRVYLRLADRIHKVKAVDAIQEVASR